MWEWGRAGPACIVLALLSSSIVVVLSCHLVVALALSIVVSCCPVVMLLCDGGLVSSSLSCIIVVCCHCALSLCCHPLWWCHCIILCSVAIELKWLQGEFNSIWESHHFKAVQGTEVNSWWPSKIARNGSSCMWGEIISVTSKWHPPLCL